MRCVDCDKRIAGEPFRYGPHSFCCECMSVFCSWLLDGGMVDDPELFRHLLLPGDVYPEASRG